MFISVIRKKFCQVRNMFYPFITSLDENETY